MRLNKTHLLISLTRFQSKGVDTNLMLETMGAMPLPCLKEKIRAGRGRRREAVAASLPGSRTVVEVVLEEAESSRWPGLGALRMQGSGAVVEVVLSAANLAGAPGSVELNPCRPEAVAAVVLHRICCGLQGNARW